MANAFEMAAMATLQKMLPGLLANLPPEITSTIGQIGGIVSGLKAQLDRIENQQRLILAHMNIPADVQTLGATDGRQSEQ